MPTQPLSPGPHGVHYKLGWKLAAYLSYLIISVILAFLINNIDYN